MSLIKQVDSESSKVNKLGCDSISLIEQVNPDSSRVNKSQSDLLPNQNKELCRYDLSCNKKKCLRLHPKRETYEKMRSTLCAYYPRCSRAGCIFQHPEIGTNVIPPSHKQFKTFSHKKPVAHAKPFVYAQPIYENLRNLEPW